MSLESMSFPDTYEEFIERYMIEDDIKLYRNRSPIFNNPKLIPVFRVQQMIEHYFLDKQQLDLRYLSPSMIRAALQLTIYEEIFTPREYSIGIDLGKGVSHTPTPEELEDLFKTEN